MINSFSRYDYKMQQRIPPLVPSTRIQIGSFTYKQNLQFKNLLLVLENETQKEQQNNQPMTPL